MDVSLAHFVGQVMTNPILAVTVLLTLGVIFVNGWPDAPNAIATCISTRCMRVRPAILLSAGFEKLFLLLLDCVTRAVTGEVPQC